MNTYKMKMIKPLLILIFMGITSCGQENRTIVKHDESSLKGIWLDTPAKSWFEAIPIGNGRLGGMVYGGIDIDTIKINEETLWSGEPRDIQNRHGLRSLPQIRQLIAEQKTSEAQKLIDSVMLGQNNQSFLPMGDLILKNKSLDDAPVRNYKRVLDLNTGLVTTQYSLGGINYKKEVFASNLDDVIVIKISSDKSASVNFSAELSSSIKNNVVSDAENLMLNGQAPLQTFPHYEGPKEVVYVDGKGMGFQMRLAVKESDGNVTISKGAIQVSDATYATLLLTAATSFNGFDKSPSSEGKDYNKICKNIIADAKEQSYNSLLNNHIEDFGNLFHRVKLNFGSEDFNDLPISERLKKYSPEKDPNLTALYYQFGRYLLISSSRPGKFAQPAHLQGIWSRLMQPAWSANWTLNCNAEINYWAVETGNLSECHLPLIQLTKDLSIDGAETAQNLYGVNGWVAHHNADLWRTTTPVGGSGHWAIYQVGSGWLCQHLWEHYLFTQDKAYLESVYPYMKGAATFYLESLQETKEGYLVTSPAISFENTFVKTDGSVGWASEGPTQDMQIIRELFQNCITASEILDNADDFTSTVKSQLKKLLPMVIKPETGRLQEWYQDWEPSNPKNGQVAHGWGLVVGTQITPRTTPKLAEAFRKTLAYRDPTNAYNSGSWTGAFPAMFYARLGDGEKSQKVIDRHFQKAISPNFTSLFFEKYWQIDGNLGITAAIGEMLMQSHAGEIELLPALASKYKNGEVKGLVARGGFEVTIKWENGKLIHAEILSKAGKQCTIRYKDKVLGLNLKKGERKDLKLTDFE